jgi:uncharacterized protein (DUF169 family)
MHDNAAIAAALVRRLGLKRPPIAISLLPELPASARLTEPVSFCQMWAKAMGGETVYATAREESCGGGAYYLGLAEASPEMRTGVLLSRVLHLNRTPMAAVRTTLASPRIPYGTGTAVLCQPLENAGPDADVVMIVCNPAAAMTLSDAVIYGSGGYMEGITGPAACSVAVAHPYLSGKPTYCAADTGSREYMQLADDEMIVSIPGDRLREIARNLEEMVSYRTG